MDPTETLKQLLEACAEINKLEQARLDNSESTTPDGGLETKLSCEEADIAVDMCELIQALHGWMSSGGFAPTQWPAPPTTLLIKGMPMYGVRSKNVAEALAKKEGLKFGFSPIQHATDPDVKWYVGTEEQLKKLGTIDPPQEMTQLELL